MRFHLPVNLYYEDNCIINHSRDIADMGTRALIITGHSSGRNGARKDLFEALEKENITWVLDEDVEQNPSVDSVMRLRDLGLANDCDFVIGVGGGSALDAAKAVAVMMLNPDKDRDYLFVSDPENLSLPVVSVPTTCGTGSEATPISVLTDPRQENKVSMTHKIFPDLSLVDDRYLASLPHGILCNTSIDAMGHMIEGLVNAKACVFSDIYAESGLKAWSRSRQVLLDASARTPENIHNLMYASIMGGFTIAHTGTCLPHGFSYTPTYYLGMPHGKAVGYFTYGFLKYAPESYQTRILDLTGFGCLEELRDFIAEATRAQRLDDAFLDKTIEIMKTNTGKIASCPYPVDDEVLRKIAYAFEG